MPPTPPPATPWDAATFRDDIQATLDAFVDEQAGRLVALGDDAARLVDAARAAVAGGKRFRAAFCYWGFRAVQGEGYDEASLLRAASALELLHASALVHDDYMDASDTRRGRPATHRAFERYHRDQGWGGDPEQYGAAAAILLGDLLLSWADEMLRTCGLDHDRVREALGFFDTTRSEVITGQFLDVSVQARAESSVEAAMLVLRYKSAKYSIERPLHVGAALGGATADDLAALTAFGLPLGEAFQLRDDLLGVFGDPAVTGKPAGDDLTEGKRTVLVALALENAPADRAAYLDSRLGTAPGTTSGTASGTTSGTALGPDEVGELRTIIEDAGAAEQVERMIDDLTARSLDALAAANVHATAREALRGLAAAATQRAL